MKINNSTFKYSNSAPLRETGNPSKCQSVSFGGNATIAREIAGKAGGAVTDGIASIMTKLGNSKLMQNMAKKLGDSKSGFVHLLALESVILSGFYMINTAKSKNIKKEQKPQMIINDALVTAFSAFCTYALDGRISKKMANFKNTFKEINKTIDPKTLDKCLNGIDKLKTIVIFGIIYRYLGPVVLTPVANKISAMLQNKKKAKNGNQDAATNTPQPAPCSPITPGSKTQPPAFKAFS